MILTILFITGCFQNIDCSMRVRELKHRTKQDLLAVRIQEQARYYSSSKESFGTFLSYGKLKKFKLIIGSRWDKKDLKFYSTKPKLRTIKFIELNFLAESPPLKTSRGFDTVPRPITVLMPIHSNITYKIDSGTKVLIGYSDLGEKWNSDTLICYQYPWVWFDNCDSDVLKKFQKKYCSKMAYPKLPKGMKPFVKVKEEEE